MGWGRVLASFGICLFCAAAGQAGSNDYFNSSSGNYSYYYPITYPYTQWIAPPKPTQASVTYVPPPSNANFISPYISRIPDIQSLNSNAELSRQQMQMALLSQEQYFKYTQQISRSERQAELKESERAFESVNIKTP